MSQAIRKAQEIADALKKFPEIQVKGSIEDSEITCSCPACHTIIYKTTLATLNKNPTLFDREEEYHMTVCKAK